MKLKRNPTPTANILSLPLSKLTAMDGNVNEGFIKELLAEIPNLGKEAETYYIFNTNLTIHGQDKQQEIAIINILLQQAGVRGHNLVQLIKN